MQTDTHIDSQHLQPTLGCEISGNYKSPSGDVHCFLCKIKVDHAVINNGMFILNLAYFSCYVLLAKSEFLAEIWVQFDFEISMIRLIRT